MYTLVLSESDLSTAHHVGHRYAWSQWILDTCEVGANALAEHQAWELAEAIEADCEGGHSPFPMLNPHSELYEKLSTLAESIV